MSLLDIRRDRKRNAGGPVRPPRLWKQALTLAIILFLIWYLDRVI